MNTIRVILFVAAALCFIFGLKMLSSPKTARRGNLVSAIGMTLAVLGALSGIIDQAFLPGGSFPIFGIIAVVLGLIIGAAIGAPAARLVKMTGMPEMVALFNGSGGAASMLIGLGEATNGNLGHFAAATVGLAVLIGGVTLTGSAIAWAKLAEKMPGKPILYPGQLIVNAGVAVLCLAIITAVSIFPGLGWAVWLIAFIALALGVAAVIPIGGADMPVVIALLNSYSGLAACAAGFAIGNLLLIVIGALVGASGLILTNIMCVAMNRSLSNVLFSGFGSTTESSGGGGEQGEAKSVSPEEAYVMLEAASSVVFVPGYGMAVAQAQHTVRELANLLEANGTEVRFAIHPVAGRMPGHMSVLLAEADVDYDQLAELEDVNPQMDAVDVAVVIGANDVVNPAAIEDPASPLAGMPIIEVHRARVCLVLKRSMRSGYAGVQNPLFFKPNTSMVFGDAKKTLEAVVGEFKAS